MAGIELMPAFELTVFVYGEMGRGREYYLTQQSPSNKSGQC